MAPDPFDLSTWYHVESKGEPMTREELAEKFCESSVALEKAKRRLKACEQLATQREIEKNRHVATLQKMIQNLTNDPDEASKRAAPLEAIKFAESVAEWKASQVRLRAAEAEAAALETEVTDAGNALVKTFEESA